MRFRDRVDAGRQLGARMATTYARRHDVVVLGLPRGGVPVAAEVARAIGAPLDVFLVRKLGVPGHAELAMGAIASGGVRVLSEDLINELGIPRTAVEQVAVRERLELDRRDRLYRGDRAMPILREKTAIIVDDGLATGASMEAAVSALRTYEPSRIVVAVPVGATESCQRLRQVADEIVCLMAPEPFQAVGLWYDRFDQTTDEEVNEILARARPSTSSGRAEGEHAELAEPRAPHGERTSEPVAPRAPHGERASEPVAPRAPHDEPARGEPVEPRASRSAIDIIRERARRWTGAARDYDDLIAAIGDARLVLIGEGSHGTHEFYRERAAITERLIADRGFDAVAVEADWPDAYRVNRYVRGESDDSTAVSALADFSRFPTWLWRNTDVVDFVDWLRAHNEGRPPVARAGFYGIDLYSLRASMDAVLAYLTRVDPDAAVRARNRYACFDQFGDEPQSYGYATAFGLAPSCEREVVTQLVEMQRQRAAYASRDGRVARDALFYAEQNARLVKNAEEYYRSMFRGRDESWNLRDRHMADTIAELLQFLGGHTARLVVWAHNSHLGDARATEMSDRGELNVGQLVRERFGADAALIGQTTHAGTVTAASDWDQPVERKAVRHSLTGSYERLLHDAGFDRCLLPLRDDLVLASAVAEPRLERAIGVIYLPRTERQSHYFTARLPNQFDFVLHADETTALEPLERTVAWEAGETADTFPSGL